MADNPDTTNKDIQAGAADAADAPDAGEVADENSAVYTWKLEGVSQLSEPRYYSPPFKCGPFDW